MPEKKPIMDITGLSGALADVLKEISTSGKNLTLANLTKTLAKRKDVSALLERTNSKGKSVSEAELDSIKALVETSENKRRDLQRQITEIESQAEREREFQRRLALALINVSRIPENEAFYPVLDECRMILNQSGDFGRREECLKRLQDSILREDIGLRGKVREADVQQEASGEKTRAAEKESPSGLLRRLRAECSDALDELQVILGEDYRATIHLAKQHVKKSREIDALIAQKTYILSIVGGFVSRAMQEKEQATAFLKEVSERLLDMEKEMLLNTQASAEVHLESDGFNAELETEIQAFHENALSSPDFQSLRALVVTQLSKITAVLQKRRLEYSSRIEMVQQESENLKKSFRTLIGQVIDKNKTLMEEVQRDPLTEIFNRRTYEISLAAEFDRYQRYRTPFSLIFFDVDHFKQVNDRYGHEAGDRVLRAISRKVRDILRKTDIFARYGGEEFVVILPETGLENGISVARKIRGLVEETVFEYEGERALITVSLGVTAIDLEDTEPAQIANRADKLLYRAKSEGRNRVAADMTLNE